MDGWDPCMDGSVNETPESSSSSATPAPEVNSRSQQKRVAAMKGEAMPTFAGPAPGAERLRELDKLIEHLCHAREGNINVAGNHAKTSNKEGFADAKGRYEVLGYVIERLQAVREALAAAPPAPHKKPFLYAIETTAGDWHDDEQCVFGNRADAQDEVDTLNEELQRGFCVVPLYREGGHASAERVRRDAFEEAACAIEREAKGWADRIAQGLYQGETLRFVDVRRDEGVYISRYIRELGALPPSTGEKS